jgi:DNA modification methylase
LNFLLIKADARAIPLSNNSVDCVITSPPYWGLRDYGVAGQIGLEPLHDCLGWATGEPCPPGGWWVNPRSSGAVYYPRCWVCEMVTVFREVRRVLKPWGTCWVNLGDTYAASTTAQHDRGKAGGPNNPNRVYAFGLKPKDLCGVPWRFALALQADGWWLRSEIIWDKPFCMPESVKDRPTKSHENIFLLTKRRHYYYDYQSIKEQDKGLDHKRHVLIGQPSLNPSGGVQQPHRGIRTIKGRNGLGRNARTIWTIPYQSTQKHHHATFPEALTERCIKAGCPMGGVVLDPFVGSGTTCRAADRLGRQAIGLDLSWEYLANIAAKRCAAPVQPMLGVAFQ